MVKTGGKNFRDREKALFERICDVTLHLASKNVPFGGKTGKPNDVHNGNYLGTLKLLSHYDPILHKPLQEVGDKKKGTQLACDYLSPDTQNKFIMELCGQRVLKTVLSYDVEAKNRTSKLRKGPTKLQRTAI